MEIAYIGTSVNVSAEHGVECDKPFCIALFYNSEPVSVEGFETAERCKIVAKEYGCTREYMF